jgi:hypothetical protein
MNWIVGVCSEKALVKTEDKSKKSSEDATNPFSGHVELQSRASLGAVALVYRT